MPLDISSHLYVLIYYRQKHQHGALGNFWSGSDASAAPCMVLNVVWKQMFENCATFVVNTDLAVDMTRIMTHCRYSWEICYANTSQTYKNFVWNIFYMSTIKKHGDDV